MPTLSKILIYPIKSLDAIEVPETMLLPGGALVHDREFAIVDQQGRFVNGKHTAKIHALRSTYDLPTRTITLRIQDSDRPAETFHLDDDRHDLATWFSEYFGYTVTLQQNLHMGFPDDTDASGPTVVSVATLEQVASWFPDLGIEEIRNRFRTNLEVAEVPAFWEDQLFGEDSQQIPFQIGSVHFLGSNPCQRCIVPTRDHLTGDRYPDFQKKFIAKRQATLPAQVALDRFNHFYKLTLNTKVSASEAGKVLRVGDTISVSRFG